LPSAEIQTPASFALSALETSNDDSLHEPEQSSGPSAPIAQPEARTASATAKTTLFIVSTPFDCEVAVCSGALGGSCVDFFDPETRAGLTD
jgi:hypothetical protein